MHFSAWRDGSNLFASGDGPYGMTDEAQSFVAGILAELPALLAIGSPSVASYLRLVPSHWAGVYQVWGRENREAAVRLVTGIVGTRDTSSNCEVKTFDLSANPYLAIGALIAAGLAGLEQGLQLPPEFTDDPAGHPAEELEELGVRRLPGVAQRVRRAPGEVGRAARGDGQHAVRGVPGGAPRRDRGVRGPGSGRHRGRAPLAVLEGERVRTCPPRRCWTRFRWSTTTATASSVRWRTARRSRATSTRASTRRPAGASHFDTPIGLAVRRWCPPVLDLEPHASADAYLERRAALGAQEVNRRLMAASGIGTLLIDTGYRSAEVLDHEEMAKLAGVPAREVVRIESVAEEVAAGGAGGRRLTRRVRRSPGRPGEGGSRVQDGARLPGRVRHRPDAAVGRRGHRGGAGGGCPASRPASPSGRVRVEDPALLRLGLWAAVDIARERGMPIQAHAGFGDPDLDIHQANPALLTGFLRLLDPLDVNVVFLHCWPYHREAGYLAAIFRNAYFDLGAALHYAGPAGDRGDGGRAGGHAVHQAGVLERRVRAARAVRGGRGAVPRDARRRRSTRGSPTTGAARTTPSGSRG